MKAFPVWTISDARAQLTGLVRQMASNASNPPIVIGSHRKPQAMLFPDGFVGRATVPTLAVLQSQKDVIHTLARAHNISTVSVTGSVARGDATEGSDVDLICDTEADADLYDIAGFELVMEQLLGFPVQALAAGSLRSPLDDALVRDAVALW